MSTQSTVTPLFEPLLSAEEAASHLRIHTKTLQACAAESYDEYLTPQEVAAILKISTDTVIRKFESLPGVLDLGSSESRFKRRYRVFRIPRQTLERFILETRICALC